MFRLSGIPTLRALFLVTCATTTDINVYFILFCVLCEPHQTPLISTIMPKQPSRRWMERMDERCPSLAASMWLLYDYYWVTVKAEFCVSVELLQYLHMEAQWLCPTMADEHLLKYVTEWGVLVAQRFKTTWSQRSQFESGQGTLLHVLSLPHYPIKAQNAPQKFIKHTFFTLCPFSVSASRGKKLYQHFATTFSAPTFPP